MAEPLKRRLPDSRFRQTRTRETRPGRQPASRRRSLWYALYIPALDRVEGATDDNTAAAHQQQLREIASRCQHVSDHISLLPPATVVFEVRSSLRYFNGIGKLRRQLEQHLPEPAPQISHAVSPTPAASALLARSNSNRLVYQQASLRSALGALPVTLLPIGERQKKQLHQSGLFHLRDLWRLPRSALQKRLGKSFVNHLQACLGERPQPLPRWQAPPQFRQRLDSDWPLATQAQLVPLFEELLEHLQGFLRRRVLATEHIQLHLHHEARDNSLINISLRQPTRSAARLLMLVQTRMDKQALPAPVLAITLSVKQFRPFEAQTITGSETTAGSDTGTLDSLLDQLEARIGRRAIRTIQTHPRWCAEDASRTTCQKTDDDPAFHRLPMRPGWLIMPPRALSMCDGKPCHRGALSMISGPERIETRWWSGAPVRRDYYVAENPRGMRLWIFAEHRKQAPLRWFLQGFFA